MYKHNKAVTASTSKRRVIEPRCALALVFVAALANDVRYDTGGKPCKPHKAPKGMQFENCRFCTGQRSVGGIRVNSMACSVQSRAIARVCVCARARARGLTLMVIRQSSTSPSASFCERVDSMVVWESHCAWKQ